MHPLKLFAILLIVGFCSYAILMTAQRKDNPIRNTATTRVAVTPVENVRTEIFFSPSSLTVSPGIPISIPIMIDTQDTVISQVQMEIKYDPGSITVLSARPADFFDQATQLINTIDAGRGRIDVALALPENLPEKKGKGTLMLLTIMPIGSASGGATTSLQFLPKTAIRDREHTYSLLKNARGITVRTDPLRLPEPSL